MEAHARGYRVTDEGVTISPRGKKRVTQKKAHGWRPAYCGFNFSFKNSQGELSTVRVNVHQLAAYQKYGDAAFRPGIVVRHLDGNHQNNCLSNIAIGTQRDNRLDVPSDVRLRTARAAGNARRRFSDREVQEIQADRREGMTHLELATKWGCATSTMSYMLSPTAKKRAYYGSNR